MRTKHLIIVLILLALLVPASPAQAEGVVTVCDEVHLLAALTGGGTVTFTCSGVITLTTEIVVATDTTIDGSEQDVTISGNSAVRVFHVISGAILNLNRLTVTNGRSDYNHKGAGIYNDNGTVTISDSSFTDNIADYDGGGIYNDNGTVTISDSTFKGNQADYEGGGIRNSGTLTISNSIFLQNLLGDLEVGSGGGINNSGALAVINSTFSENRAGSVGGGIYNSGMLVVSNSTFSDNRVRDGGGIGGSGRLDVSNCTFSGNYARGGGGIWFGYSVNQAEVSNSTFSGNRATYAGGIFSHQDSMMTLQNTIVANSTTGNNCIGAFTDGGGNLSYPDNTCPGVNADPLLGPLQDNGGPTWTMALDWGSAAIDAGNDAICAADPVNGLDQRGILRPQGAHCDIGAVERSLPFRVWLPTALSQ